MKKIAVLPSLLTLGNAFCGFLAIAYTADGLLYTFAPSVHPADFQQRIFTACWLILLAMVFDALDGKVARMTKHATDFGGHLDSLCDAVSFGVAPAIVAKVLIDHETTMQGMMPHPRLYFLAASLFALCAILRLARFNVESDSGEESHRVFRGLPSPAAAGVIVSTCLLYTGSEKLAFPQIPTFILPLLLTVIGLLMVSRVPYVHFVSYLLRGRKAFPFLIQIVLVLAVAAVEPVLAIPFIFYAYLILGPIPILKERWAKKHQLKDERHENAPSPE